MLVTITLFNVYSCLNFYTIINKIIIVLFWRPGLNRCFRFRNVCWHRESVSWSLNLDAVDGSRHCFDFIISFFGNFYVFFVFLWNCFGNYLCLYNLAPRVQLEKTALTITNRPVGYLATGRLVTGPWEPWLVHALVMNTSNVALIIPGQTLF